MFLFLSAGADDAAFNIRRRVICAGLDAIIARGDITDFFVYLDDRERALGFNHFIELLVGDFVCHEVHEGAVGALLLYELRRPIEIFKYLGRASRLYMQMMQVLVLVVGLDAPKDRSFVYVRGFDSQINFDTV